MVNTKFSFSEAELVKISRVASSESEFTILYELVYRDEPASAFELRKTFGADPSEIAGILRDLEFRKLVRRKGRAYSTTQLGSRAIQFLEEMFTNRQLQTEKPASAGDSVTLDLVVSDGAPMADGQTNNGAWVANQVTFNADGKRQTTVAAATPSATASVASRGTEACNTRSPSFVTT